MITKDDILINEYVGDEGLAVEASLVIKSKIVLDEKMIAIYDSDESFKKYIKEKLICGLLNESKNIDYSTEADKLLCDIVLLFKDQKDVDPFKDYYTIFNKAEKYLFDKNILKVKRNG